MSEAMHAEFDTLAAWTAQVASDLGPAAHLPAACKGSGSPAALEWLLDQLQAEPGSILLDSGAGLGGPSAFARAHRQLRPLLVEPEAGAAASARTLFGLPTVRGDAAALPVASGSCDAAWSLGVLCTMADQAGMLRELVRVTAPPHRVALMVFVAQDENLPREPEGNDFPTAERLLRLVTGCRQRVESWQSAGSLAPAPDDWTKQVEAVDAELERRYSDAEAWRVAQRQSARIGELLASGDVTAQLLSLRS